MVKFHSYVSLPQGICKHLKPLGTCQPPTAACSSLLKVSAQFWQFKQWSTFLGRYSSSMEVSSRNHIGTWGFAMIYIFFSTIHIKIGMDHQDVSMISMVFQPDSLENTLKSYDFYDFICLLGVSTHFKRSKWSNHRCFTLAPAAPPAPERAGETWAVRDPTRDVRAESLAWRCFEGWR